jgi:hypothetical protein
MYESFLNALPHDAREVWADATMRQASLIAILRAWELGSPALGALVPRLDAAVVAGLVAVGLPRGPVAAVQVVDADSRWLGQKTPECVLQLAGDGLHQLVRQYGEPDRFFRTWVHESLHARQPYAPRAAIEQRQTRGYEEGMVEGLARLVLVGKARIPHAGGSYEYYVTAYTTLARILIVDVEILWRELWRHRTGEVREVFAETVDQLRFLAAGVRLSDSDRGRLLAVADTVFGSDRARARPEPSLLEALWRTVLR